MQPPKPKGFAFRRGAFYLETYIENKNAFWEFPATLVTNFEHFEYFVNEIAHHHELVELFGCTNNRGIFLYDNYRLFDTLLCCELLKVVKLSMNQLGDKIAYFINKFIRESYTCISLDLSHNNFTAKGLATLKDSLMINDSLLDFKMTHNPLKNEAMETMADIIAQNKTLESIDISNTGFEKAGEDTLREGLLQNRSLRALVYTHIAQKQQPIEKRLRENQLLWREKFLRDLKQEQTGKWNRSKLMFIGQGRAGKTSTVKRLLNQGFEETQDSTVGASVSQTQTSTTQEQKWKKVTADDPEYLGKGMKSGNAGKVIAARKLVDKQNNKDRKGDDKNRRKRLQREAEQRRKRMDQRDKNRAAAGEAFTEEMRRQLEQEEMDRQRREQEAADLLMAQEIDRKERKMFNGAEDGEEQEMLKKYEEEERRRKEEEEEDENAKLYADAVFKAARETKDSITFSLWDYGGQTVFYALHHLFLTKYGIYVLCVDMREILRRPKVAKEYLLFWLNSVKLHAPTAPVLLVGTYLDEVSEKEQLLIVNQFVVENFSKRFEQMMCLHPKYAFYPVDNKNNKGVNELRFDIERVSRKQEFVTADVSLRWLFCLDKMMVERDTGGEQPAWLALHRVREVAERVNMKSHEELEKMLDLFHELGVLVRLTGTEELRSIITLDPQWLVDGLCKVIRDNKLHGFSDEELTKAGLKKEVEVLYDKGLASLDVMKYLWKDEAWKDHHDFLLDLMKYMVLISDWDFRDEKMFIIPSLLTPRLEEIDLFAHPLEDEHQLNEIKKQEDAAKAEEAEAAAKANNTEETTTKANGQRKKSSKKPKKRSKIIKVLAGKKSEKKEVEKTEENGEVEEVKEPEERIEESLTDYAVFDFSKVFLPLGVFQRLVCLCVSYSTSVGGSTGKKVTEPELYSRWAKIWMGNDTILFLEQRGDQIWLSVDEPSTAKTCFKAVNSMLNKLNADLMGSGLRWDITLKRVRRIVRQTEGKKPKIKEQHEVDMTQAQAKKKGLEPWFKKEAKKEEKMQELINLENFIDAF